MLTSSGAIELRYPNGGKTIKTLRAADGDAPTQATTDDLVAAVLTTLLGSGLDPEKVLNMNMEAAIALCIVYRRHKAYERLAYIADTVAILSSVMSSKPTLKAHIAPLLSEIQGE